MWSQNHIYKNRDVIAWFVKDIVQVTTSPMKLEVQSFRATHQSMIKLSISYTNQQNQHATPVLLVLIVVSTSRLFPTTGD